MKYITKALGFLFGFLFIFSICSIDSEGWWPFVLLTISGIALYVMAWRNGWFYDPELEEEE